MYTSKINYSFYYTPSVLKDNSLWLFLSFQLLMGITFTTPSAYFYLSTWLVIFWVFGWQTRALGLLYYHPLSRYLRTSFNNLGCSSINTIKTKHHSDVNVIMPLYFRTQNGIFVPLVNPSHHQGLGIAISAGSAFWRENIIVCLSGTVLVIAIIDTFAYFSSTCGLGKNKVSCK